LAEKAKNNKGLYWQMMKMMMMIIGSTRNYNFQIEHYVSFLLTYAIWFSSNNCDEKQPIALCTMIHSFISIQPLGWFSRNQNPVRWPVWLWHTESWANS
jgi:hypothetical protein